MAKDLEDKGYVASSLGNIGNVYLDQGDCQNALKHYFEALEIAKETNDKRNIAIWLSNIGAVYFTQGDSAGTKGNSILQTESYSNSLNYYNDALVIARELKNNSLVATWLGYIGSLYTAHAKCLDNKKLQLDKYLKAEMYLSEALALSDSAGTLSSTMDIEKYLSDLYTQTQRYSLALEHYKNYTAAKDSIFNETSSKQ